MKKILMINESRSQIASELRKSGSKFIKDGNIYLTDKIKVKFIKTCNVNQELIDWADIICSHQYNSELLEKSGKKASTPTLLTLKYVLYGGRIVYFVREYVDSIKIVSMHVTNDVLNDYLKSSNCFLDEKEAIIVAKEKIEKKIFDYQKALESLKTQLQEFEKDE